jgi:nucleoside 2-deoxyribosyltransferase
MKKCHIILSCNKEDITVENECLEDFLNTYASDLDIKIKCIGKHNNVSASKIHLDELKENSIYLANINTKLDHVNFWEIGYAMGRELPIIGFSSAENGSLLLNNDIDQIVSPVVRNIDQLIDTINLKMSNLKPKVFPIRDDWEEQSRVVGID